ncbi:TnsD family Tn7-like transposition protein [Paenibacillus sp. FSL L8-0696]|uniref:TnsD family Tn7-like transposition protein n=1 Tax=Paenibacillus sp. FSL L8-0696 TaxID=2954524 RepID=UPI00311A8884
MLLSVLREGNVSTRVELKALKRTQYNWLSKNDKTWFEVNMPAARKGGSKELNFSLIDLELSEKIVSISERLFMEDLSKQIKPYTILVQLSKEDFGRFNLYKRKLPLSEKKLEECSEKRGDYLLRILPRVVEYLKHNTRYKNITFESIRSVKRVYKGCSETDRNRIEEALNRYLTEKERKS